MAANPIGGSTAPKPSTHATDPKADTAPKRPGGEDGKAARNAPDETSTAVQNSFGKVPGGGKQPDSNAKNSNAKQPGNGAKAPAGNPKAGGEAPKAPANDAKQPGGTDPRQPASEHRLGDYAKTADGKDYAKTADGKYYIAYDKSLGGNAVAIDSRGKRVDDGNGNPKAVDSDGNYALTVDGKGMVYPAEAGGKMAAIEDTAKGTVLLKGPQDKVYLVNPDGNYAVTVDGKYMAYDPAPDGKVVAISGGAIATDAKGHAYTLNADGSYMQPEDGKFGVLNAYNKIVAADAATGEVVKDANGHAYVLDNSGKYVQPEAGKFAVYNEQTGKTIATDGKGNPVTDGNGNPYLVGDDGHYVKTADGKYAVYTPKLSVKDLTLYRNEKQEAVVTADGLSLYQDKSGKFVGVSNGGMVVEIDPVSGKMVTDPATGAPVVLNDPYAERPLGTENMNVMDTLSKMPIGVERGDPMAVKSELFKDGVLDKESLYAAMGKYDARDVYDALVNASRYGGWNNAPHPGFESLLHPDEATARMLIAGMIAWHNDNGGYKPMKEGEMPFVGLVALGNDMLLGYSLENNVFINRDGFKEDMFKGLDTLHHELNHAYASKAFVDKLQERWGDSGRKRLDESITEYLSNKWTQDLSSVAYDKWPEMKTLDDTVREIGGGDVNAGTDILKRAYFQGDPVATQIFLASFAKAFDAQQRGA